MTPPIERRRLDDPPLLPEESVLYFLLDMKKELREDIKVLREDVRDRTDRISEKLDDHIQAHVKNDERLSLVESRVKVIERVGWGGLAAIGSTVAGYIKGMIKP